VTVFLTILAILAGCGEQMQAFAERLVLKGFEVLRQHVSDAGMSRLL
jgi:hypothetical protein